MLIRLFGHIRQVLMLHFNKKEDYVNKKEDYET